MTEHRRRNLPRAAALLLVLAVAGTWLATTQLRVDPDTDALLSEAPSWRQQARAVRQAFPEQFRQLVVLIHGPVPEQVESSAERVRETLARIDGLENPRVPAADPYLRRQALLLMPQAQFEATLARIAALAPMLAGIGRQPDLAGLFELLTRAGPPEPGTPLATLHDRLTDHLRQVNGGQALTLSWQSLAFPGAAQTPLAVIANSRSLEEEPRLLREARDRLGSVEADLPPGVRLQLTGEIPLWHDELDAANRGAVETGLTAFALVLGLLWLLLRSLRQVAASLVTLAAGLAITAGYAVLAVGTLNLISVAFAALFIGLAIDFALHWLFAWRAEGAAGARAVRPALGLCALTTALAFLAFVPTSYRGVAELGHIGAAGILFGLLCAMLLLPALLPDRAQQGPLPEPKAGRLSALAWRYPSRTLLVLGLLLAAAVPIARDARFDRDPTRLKPDSPALQAYRELREGPGSALQATLLTSDAESAERAAASLRDLPVVGAVRSAHDLLPHDAALRLPRIEALHEQLPPFPDAIALSPPDPASVRESARALAAALDEGSPLATELYRWLARTTDAELPNHQAMILGTLPALQRRLRDSLQAAPVGLDTMPASLRSTWVSDDGRWLLRIAPSQPLETDRELLRFADTVRDIAPDATGLPIEYVEGARTVIGAFEEAFALALFAAVLVLGLSLRRAGDVLIALLPLLGGAVLYLAVTTRLGLPLNFANIIALPLLFGVAVDTGIHLVWRHRKHPQHNPLHSATGQAVGASILTTLASFLALTLSPHPGMASMGAHLAIGLLCLLAVTLVGVPAALALVSRRG